MHMHIKGKEVEERKFKPEMTAYLLGGRGSWRNNHVTTVKHLGAALSLCYSHGAPEKYTHCKLPNLIMLDKKKGHKTIIN